MEGWKIALLAAALPFAAILTIFFFFWLCYVRSSSSRASSSSSSSSAPVSSASSAPAAAAAAARPAPFSSSSASRHSSRVASAWRSTHPAKPFSWSLHPSLISLAVDHGWPSFSFSYSCSTCPAPPNLWHLCTSCSHHRQLPEPDLSWDIGRAGSDHLQKIWFHPGAGRKQTKKEHASAAVQALQTALPLPGPPLGPHSFPQEGYFEITVLAEGREYNADASQSSLTDNEHVKLISKRVASGKDLGFLLAAGNKYANHAIEEQKEGEQEEAMENGEKKLIGSIEFSRIASANDAIPSRRDGEQLQTIAVGFAAGGAPPFRLPGSDPVSVGFHSSGRVYLNGALHLQQEPKFPALNRCWGFVNSTVGCGFDPAAKRVYFTLNGECVYELATSSSDFGNPLYPTVAANYDVTVLANFGQGSFEYLPANAQRVPDPCFRRAFSRSAKNASVNEDSGDLFSMGRIDSQWFAELESPSSDDLQHRHVLSEAESDLFEIVLDARS